MNEPRLSHGELKPEKQFAHLAKKCDGTSMAYLIVLIGGGIGAALRHGVNVAAARLFGNSFPYGTLAVNVTGSLAMGLLVAYLAFKSNLSQHWNLFLTTGVLGGFTTFSTFSLDFAVLYERGECILAAFYVLLSLALSFAGLFVGLAIIRNMT